MVQKTYEFKLGELVQHTLFEDTDLAAIDRAISELNNLREFLKWEEKTK